ncbi:toxin-antitoxin system YwqK family antitoxin [Mesonia aestuariivivens]|uniref:Toxin-antitoxin system YwqK family antitoxin n=1 Tax=Mesonia aestuariivivens TaxID=2796128 RepID=A0ABS6W5Q1_9FLAO|nr:hypothetical protein [Mesonia aestuariivivens]MBW2962852.1 hypothetical protein [Mesonia aestuariivivens]
MFNFIKNGFLLLFILNSSLIFAQKSDINQFDANEERHGKWIKKFEGTNQIRYSGEFNHGQEVGTFKFYKKGNEEYPEATKTYTEESDIVSVEFFTPKGKLLTKGQFKDKKRIGEWIYFHKGTAIIMMKENYKNDLLNGLKSIYFENGKLAETQEYLKGIKQGENFIYGANGNLIQYYNYQQGSLDGACKIYNPQGKLTAEGNYKKGLRDGIWKFHENEKLTHTEKFPKEKPSVRKKK